MAKWTLKSDNLLDDKTRKAIQAARDEALTQAEAVPLCERFTTRLDTQFEAVHITDTKTGTSYTMGLYGYAEVRAALDGLYANAKK